MPGWLSSDCQAQSVSSSSTQTSDVQNLTKAIYGTLIPPPPYCRVIIIILYILMCVIVCYKCIIESIIIDKLVRIDKLGKDI